MPCVLSPVQCKVLCSSLTQQLRAQPLRAAGHEDTYSQERGLRAARRVVHVDRYTRLGCDRLPARRPAMKTIAELQRTFPRAGRVEWIGVRPARHAPLVPLEGVEALAATGLRGDRYASGGKRQVTLIQAEHLAVLSSLVGSAVQPAQLRRNILVSGINLWALRAARFRVGGALLEGTGSCDPCSRMEEALGPGGYNAMRGHGGITARVLESGWIRLGDALEHAAVTDTTA